MRIVGGFGRILAVDNVRRSGEEGGRLDGVRVTYRFGGGVRGLGKGRRQHPGRSEGSKGVGIERGREDIGELAGEGLVGIVGVDQSRHLVGHGWRSSGNWGVQYDGSGWGVEMIRS